MVDIYIMFDLFDEIAISRCYRGFGKCNAFWSI